MIRTATAGSNGWATLHKLVSACLPDVFEGRGLPGWPGREVVEFLQERGRDREEAPALLLGVSEPAVELVGPVDDHMPSVSCS
jgi:hypothetical protein